MRLQKIFCLLMQSEEYAETFARLQEFCRMNGLAVQTIKSAALVKYKGRWSHATWYQPLSEAGAIAQAVKWVLRIPEVFLVTTGDLTVLPQILAAGADYDGQPSDDAMRALVQEQEMEPLFA